MSGTMQSGCSGFVRRRGPFPRSIIRTFWSCTISGGHCRELRGFIHCPKREFTQGAEALADAMTLFEQIQVNCASHVLETAATWAAMIGRFELGAEILGSARRIREETGDKPRPWERAVQDTWLPKIAGALDPAVFDAAHGRGARRRFGAALDFARRELRAAR